VYLARLQSDLGTIVFPRSPVGNDSVPWSNKGTICPLPQLEMDCWLLGWVGVKEKRIFLEEKKKENKLLMTGPKKNKITCSAWKEIGENLERIFRIE
jgi:hypothetical protein